VVNTYIFAVVDIVVNFTMGAGIKGIKFKEIKICNNSDSCFDSFDVNFDIGVPVSLPKTITFCVFIEIGV
jgi:hypothetical protein